MVYKACACRLAKATRNECACKSSSDGTCLKQIKESQFSSVKDTVAVPCLRVNNHYSLRSELNTNLCSIGGHTLSILAFAEITWMSCVSAEAVNGKKQRRHRQRILFLGRGSCYRRFLKTRSWFSIFGSEARPGGGCQAHKASWASCARRRREEADARAKSQRPRWACRKGCKLNDEQVANIVKI